MMTFLSIGAGPGNGLATAERFAREGFQLVLSTRNEAKTNELAEQLRAKAYKAAVRTVNAGDPASVAALVSEVEGTFDGVDVLHYNAASMRQATLIDQPRDTVNSDLAVNIGGAMIAIQAAAPKMIARGSGSVLLTGGGYALHPSPDYLSLSIGKAGIRALAHAIFGRFKAQGVHVATVTVGGAVTTKNDADAVADYFWQLHSQPSDAWEVEVAYTPKG